LRDSHRRREERLREIEENARRTRLEREQREREDERKKTQKK